MATKEHFIYNGPSGDRIWDSAKYADEVPGILVDFHVADAEEMSKDTLTARITGIMRDNSIRAILIISGFIDDSTFTGRYHIQTRKGILCVTTAETEPGEADAPRVTTR